MSRVQQLLPSVQMVTVPPFGPFSFGSNFFILGKQQKVLIDCGNGHPSIQNIIRELKISKILITHKSQNHSGLKQELRQETTKIDELTLQCIKTPGHTQDHCVYFCPELDGLFSGDLLQARFGHPMTQMLFGDLRSYLKSLQTVAHLGPKLLFPGHGEFSWQCHLDIQKTRELAAKMIETVHQMIIQQEATVTKDIIQKFAQKHKITDPTDVFVLKGSIRMVLEYLKDKIVQTNQINDPYKTTMDVNKKGPGGLTMEQIFARVQESRRLDNRKSSLELLHPIHQSSLQDFSSWKNK